jgi:iron(III) transport system permease protein
VTKTAAQSAPSRLLVAAALLAAAIVAIPIAYLVLRASSGGLEGFVAFLQRPRLPLLIANTLLLGFTVTLATILIGVPSAFLLSRFALAARPFWMVVAALPLAIPSYLSAYGLLAVFPTMQGFWAAWLVLTMVSVPYVTLPVATILRNATTDLEDVARTLGRSGWRARFAGSWHQVRAATLAGALLAFLYSIADFGGVSLFRFPVLTTAIQQAYGSSYDRNYAALLSVILVLIAVIIVIAERRARGTAARTISTQRTIGGVRLSRLKPAGAWVFVLLSIPATVAVIIPIAFIIGRMLSSASLTELSVSRLFAATANTVVLSVVGALIALIIAAPIAILTARNRGRLARIIDTVGHLPLALPGIVVGLSLVLFALNVVPALYQTVFLLAFGYAVLYMPKALGSVRTRVSSIPRSLEDVSRTLGYAPRQTWWSVVARLSRPGFVLGGLLVAVAAMKELPATLLLRPTGVDTLATMLWARTDVAEYGAGAPYAIMLVLVAAVPALILSQADRVGGRSS